MCFQSAFKLINIWCGPFVVPFNCMSLLVIQHKGGPLQVGLMDFYFTWKVNNIKF